MAEASFLSYFSSLGENNGLKCSINVDAQDFTGFYKNLCHQRLKNAGADLGFSRGGQFFKKISKILSTFFLGRPN